MNAQLTKVDEVRPEELAGYDLIGFGFGIYGLKHHKALIELIEAVPATDKSVFVFSTCGNVRRSTTSSLRTLPPLQPVL